MHWTWLLYQPSRNGQPRFEDWILFAYQLPRTAC
jgi:hypothetical protein